MAPGRPRSKRPPLDRPWSPSSSHIPRSFRQRASPPFRVTVRPRRALPAEPEWCPVARLAANRVGAMDAVWLTLRSELRWRWRAWAGLGLLVGLVGGIV